VVSAALNSRTNFAKFSCCRLNNISRLRQVLNAVATTVFGVPPLLQDVFWVSLTVAIMFGLAFGTVLTMIVVPVLYAMLFRITTMSK